MSNRIPSDNFNRADESPIGAPWTTRGQPLDAFIPLLRAGAELQRGALLTASECLQLVVAIERDADETTERLAKAGETALAALKMLLEGERTIALYSRIIADEARERLEIDERVECLLADIAVYRDELSAARVELAQDRQREADVIFEFREADDGAAGTISPRQLSDVLLSFVQPNALVA